MSANKLDLSSYSTIHILASYTPKNNNSMGGIMLTEKDTTSNNFNTSYGTRLELLVSGKTSIALSEWTEDISNYTYLSDCFICLVADSWTGDTEVNVYAIWFD